MPIRGGGALASTLAGVARRIRFRPPGVKPGQKIGPLGPFRGRLGIHWVVAPIVLGVVLLVAGWLYFFG